MTADQLIAEASRCYTAYKYDSAAFYYREAGLKYQKEGNNYGYQILKLYEARAFMSKGELKHSWELVVDVVDATEQSTELNENNYFLGELYNTAGLVCYQQQRPSLAVQYLTTSIDYFNKDGSLPNNQRAWNYISLANAEWMFGRFDDALFHTRIADSLFLGANETASHYDAEFTRAIILSERGDYTDAVALYNELEPRYDAIYGKNQLVQSILFNNRGVCYLFMERWDQAFLEFNKSLKIRERIDPENPDVNNLWFNIGYTFYRKHDYDSAVKYLTISNRRLDKMELPIVRISAWSHNSLAGSFYHQKKYDAGLAEVQKALEVNTSGKYLAANIYGQPSVEDLAEYIRFIESLELKGRLMREIAKEKNDLNKMKFALSCYELADSVSTLARSRYVNEGDKLNLVRHTFEVYEGGIITAFYLYEMTKDPVYLSKAYYLSERSKSTLLLEAIRETKAGEFHGVPDSIYEKEVEMAQELFAIQKEMENADLGAKTSLILQLNAARAEQDRLRDMISERYPDYYDLKYGDQVVPLTRIQQQLNSDECLYSYFIAEGKTFVFRIKAAQTDLLLMPEEANMYKRIVAMRNAILFKEKATYIKSARALYTDLFPDSTPGKKLILVPHGELAMVPFEALLTSEVKPETPYDQMPYLIKQSDIRYAFSVSLWSRMQQKGADKPMKSFIGMAPVFNGSSSEMSPASDTVLTRAGVFKGGKITPIPATEKELVTIHGMFPASQALLNQHATEDQIKSGVLGDYKYVHIATHGFVDAEHPELSGILLYPHTTGKEDNILYASEMYQLHLNADLVTLSACETGIGRVNKGEGMIGLTRPLFYAGARNLVVSLWKVADNSTSELMISMYNQIKLTESTVPSYSNSLTLAKRKMISAGKYAEPYYWSSFILIGR